MSKLPGAKGGGACLKHVLNARHAPGRLGRLEADNGARSRVIRERRSDARVIGANEPLCDPDEANSEVAAAAVQEQRLLVDRLFRTEAPKLARFFDRRVPRDDVRDLVQESFRRILHHRPERPGAFLQQTANNLVREFHRLRARGRASFHEPFTEHHAPIADPHAGLEARDALARLRRGLDQLAPKTRNIFLMSRIEGMTYAEIGAAYGMSEEGVKKRVAAAMHHLRRRVGDLR